MSTYDYDLLVIGAGSGGVRASRIAAQLGAKVAIVEERYLGGTCVNVGCVPKKLFVYSSHYRDALMAASGFGWKIENATFDWPTLRENKNKEIARLNQVYRKLLMDAGVPMLDGRASLVDVHRVRVNNKIYTAERILLAVGGWPWVPEFPGSEHALTSNDMFYLDRLPKKIMIVGGGYIGVEFAGILHGLGVETHLCHRGDFFLKGFDDDVRFFAAEEMRKKGIHLHFNTDIATIEKIADQDLRVTAKDGQQWQMGEVLYATGRRPMTENLGLENTRVIVNDNGSIAVDDFFQTAEPSIYALGDAVGRMALTPVALAEGMMFARNIYDRKVNEAPQKMDYRNIPTAVFCQPSIATLGLTEAQARQEFDAIDVYKTSFKPMQFALSGSDEKTFMKLLVARTSDKIVGCHMVGPEAAEIMQGLAIAVRAGATKKDFDNTMGIHPTLAEEFVTLRQPVK